MYRSAYITVVSGLKYLASNVDFFTKRRVTNPVITPSIFPHPLTFPSQSRRLFALYCPWPFNRQQIGDVKAAATSFSTDGLTRKSLMTVAEPPKRRLIVRGRRANRPGDRCARTGLYCHSLLRETR